MKSGAIFQNFDRSPTLRDPVMCALLGHSESINFEGDGKTVIIKCWRCGTVLKKADSYESPRFAVIDEI